MFYSRILAVVSLLNLALFCEPGALRAEETSSAVSSVEQEAVSSEAPESSSEDIQPLDHWVEASSEENSAEVVSESGGPSELTDEVPETPVIVPTPKFHFPVVGAERSTLKKIQKARLDKVERKIRGIVYQETQAQIAKTKLDPRGNSEIRICSVNFNGFGTKEENQRLLKKIPKPRLAKTERSIIKAIGDSKCDLVSVQGIVGRSPSFALDALTGFAAKLSKRTDKIPWKVEVAHSKEQAGYQGFLIKDAENGPIVGSHVETITDSIMKVPGRTLRKTITLKNEIVPRDFMKLTLEVKSEDPVKPDPLSLETKSSKKETREIVIINGILAKSVAPFQADDRLLKLQIADVAVRIFVEEQSRVTPNEQPIVLATIERVEGVMGGAQQILNGRLNIDDFETDGICKIVSGQVPPPKEEGADEEVKKEEKGKPSKVIDFTIDTAIECHTPLDRPQPRFDILQSVPFEKRVKPPEDSSKKAPKISKRDLELQTAGIFVVSADLKYSAKKGPNLLNSAAGRVQISNGLPGAYLVWVDLNW